MAPTLALAAPGILRSSPQSNDQIINTWSGRQPRRPHLGSRARVPANYQVVCQINHQMYLISPQTKIICQWRPQGKGQAEVQRCVEGMATLL